MTEEKKLKHHQIGWDYHFFSFGNFQFEFKEAPNQEAGIGMDISPGENL